MTLQEEIARMKRNDVIFSVVFGIVLGLAVCFCLVLARYW